MLGGGKIAAGAEFQPTVVICARLAAKMPEFSK